MPAPSTRTPGRLFVAAALATIALLAGCGSSHGSGTQADPATATPASAPLYAGAIVRPSGQLKDGALAVGRALSHEADPYLRLLEALQTPGSPKLDFNRDVAPWLGQKAGVFLDSLDNSGSLLSLLEQGLLHGSGATVAFPFGRSLAQGAFVLDTTDAGKAQSFLHSQAAHAGAHNINYRGVTFEVTSDGVAFALVSRFAVIGSEAGVHAVIDTTLGGPSLAHAPGYSKLLAAAPAGALANVYANPAVPGASPAASGVASPAPSGPSSSQSFSGLLGVLAGKRVVLVSAVPSITAISLDVDTLATASPGTEEGLLPSGPEAARALGELPGESWLALGLSHVGAGLAGDVQGLRALTSLAGAGSGEGSSSGLVSLGGLLNGLLKPLGVLSADTPEARRDFTSWMGSGGIFASGSGLLELKAAVVINSNSPALSRAAVGKLGAALHKSGASVQPASIPGTDASVEVRLSGLPLALDIANARTASGQTKFILGLGAMSVTGALNPSTTLSGAASTTAAEAALGEGIAPSLMVDFPTLVSLLEAVGLTEAPPISQFVPYLRAVTTLDGGGKSLGGGIDRFRLVLGLRPAG